MSERRTFQERQPSLEEVRALYAYDPETGLFSHRVNRERSVQGAAAGTKTSAGYISISIRKQRYVAHRLAWLLVHGEWPSEQIDHINGVRDDNRIANLRPASQSQQNANTRVRSDNGTGVKGVSFDKIRNRYRACIVVDGKQRQLGRFSTLEQAAAAYRAAAREQFGEFANPGNHNNAVGVGTYSRARVIAYRFI